jgi:integrase
MRLTDESIKRRRRPTKGQLLLWDDLVSGFGVRLTPTKTSFVVQWRETSSRKPRESLRPHWPALSVARARELARTRLGEVVAIKDSAGGVALRVAIRRWYERQTEIGSWRPRYRSKVDSIISTYFEGLDNPRVKLTAAAKLAITELSQKPVSSVTRSDVMRVINAIKPGIAEQVMAIGSSFYNTMLEQGVECLNPYRNRLRVTGGRSVRSRALTEAEFLTLWRALEAEGDPALGAFAMLAYTGCRRREITQLHWSEVDLEAATITLPPERRKTGKKDPEPFVINLHPTAVEILRRQPVLEGNAHVFWGRRDKKPFDFHFAVMQRLHALKIPDWRLHDIRRFVRSGMARLGVTQVVAELCLGHSAKSGLVAVYDQHAYTEEKLAAWLKWGDHLTRLVGGRL